VAVVAQRNGVRVVAFQKCGHTSIINMFLTPADMSIVRGDAPAVRNSGDEAAAIGAYRGSLAVSLNWPKPEFTIAFFREPIRRTLSAYQHFVVRTLKDIGGVKTLGRRSFTDLGYDADMTFPEFCGHLQYVNLQADNHLRPQTEALMVAGYGTVFGRQLEELSYEWPILVDFLELDCTKEVATFNAAEYDVTEHLAGNHVAIIEQLYEDDYILWNEARAPISSVSH